MTETTLDLESLLKKLVEMEGSDLHLKVGSPPAFRVSGEIQVPEHPVLRASDTEAMANELMPDAARGTLEEAGEVGFAYGRPSVGRFRVNVFKQRGSMSIAVRSISATGIPSLESLGLPRILEDLSKASRGLILVTGGAGSGKTTTLTALLDHINATRRVNIVTLEDPIEVLHVDKRSLVSQREVGLDTPSIAEGLEAALRQDPDVVYASELRNRGALDAALLTARTGHLVLSSMLASDAIDAISKMIEMYPLEQHDRVRKTLADSIKAIISLRLMSRLDGNGRVVASEVLINTDRARAALAGEAGAIPLREVIIDGGYFGMHSFDQSLLKLHQQDLVSFQDALANANDPNDFKLAVQAMGLRSA